ncbi:hypothetical protein ACFL6K_05865 [Candidatus Latescibacterota bacterium]
MLKYFLRLCSNEIRRNKILLLLEIIALAGYNFFFLTFSRIHDKDSLDIVDYGLTLMLFIVILSSLPMIIYFSFALERRTKINHMLLSFPVQRKWLMLSKFTALSTPLVIIPFVVGVIEIIIFFNPYFGFGDLMYIFKQHFYLIFSQSIIITSTVIFISGLLCAAESLYHSMKRFNAVPVFIFLMASQTLVLWSAKFTIMFYDPIKNLSLSDSSLVYIELLRQNMSIMSQYVTFVGFLLLGAALIIYEKFAEV